METYDRRDAIVSVLYYFLHNQLPVTFYFEESPSPAEAFVEWISLDQATFGVILRRPSSRPLKKKISARGGLIYLGYTFKFETRVSQASETEVAMALPAAITSYEENPGGVKLSHRDNVSAVVLFGLFQGVGVYGKVLEISSDTCVIAPDKGVDVKSQHPVILSRDLLESHGPSAFIRIMMDRLPDQECEGSLIDYVEDRRGARLEVAIKRLPPVLKSRIDLLISQRRSAPHIPMNNYPSSGLLRHQRPEDQGPTPPPASAGRTADPPQKQAPPAGKPPVPPSPAPPPASPSAQAATAAAPPAGRVLIIDSAGGQELARLIRENFPEVEALVAEDFPRAAALLWQTGIQVVLADYQDSADRAARAMTAFKSRRIIFMHQSITPEDFKALFLQGFREILTKPLDLDRLGRILRPGTGPAGDSSD